MTTRVKWFICSSPQIHKRSLFFELLVTRAGRSSLINRVSSRTQFNFLHKVTDLLILHSLGLVHGADRGATFMEPINHSTGHESRRRENTFLNKLPAFDQQRDVSTLFARVSFSHYSYIFFFHFYYYENLSLFRAFLGLPDVGYHSDLLVALLFAQGHVISD